MDHGKMQKRPLKSGYGEEWRKSVGQDILQMKKCCQGLEKKEIHTIRKRQKKWIGHMLIGDTAKNGYQRGNKGK